MGTKTAAITVILAILMTSLGTVGYIIYSNQNNEDTNKPKEAVDLPLSSYTPKSQRTLGMQNTENSNQIQPQLPKPDEFQLYEQFSDAQSTQYLEITAGKGAEATRGTKAHVVYTGYLTNGKIFDQSKINGNGQLVAFAFTLGANQVIQGWEQGIFGMKEGGKRRLIIPSQFAYGEQGQEPIPPNSMLIFDVELVRVDPPQVVPGS